MISLGGITWENIKEHNLSSPQILHHPNRLLIVGSSGLGKTNSLLNLINQKNLIKYLKQNISC